MGKDEFVAGLKGMEFEIHDLADNRVAVGKYSIEDGRFKGQVVKVGFEIPLDFPATPPSGPHINPCLIPMNPSGTTHNDKAVPSPLGDGWQYLSRPYPNWPGTKRSMPVYMAHIRQLLETL